MPTRNLKVAFFGACLAITASTAALAQSQGENNIVLPFPTEHRHDDPGGQSSVIPWPVLLAKDPALFGCDVHLTPFPVDLSDPSLISRYFLSDLQGTLFPSVQNPSVCFEEFVFQVSGDSTPTPDQIRGKLMNVDPLHGPSVPTLPPLNANLVDGTSPLLPAGVDGAYEPLLAMAERSTAGGTLDLVTGSPLLRAVDFELPFGGSTFRYVRTYSEPATFVDDRVSSSVADLVRESTPNSRMWDWHGVGWMVGHNPLFLFDSARAGQTDLVPGTTFANRRCYFIPDAHHAIPFDMRIVGDEGSEYPVYEAPARFGAHMTYEGGVWDNDLYATGVGGWTELPELVYVWLNDGAVKYTIAVLYEDVPALPDLNDPTSGTYANAHWRPDQAWSDSNQSFGVPFIGLTLQIEDRYGNRIVNEYCGFHQYNCSLHSDGATGQDPEKIFGGVQGQMSTEPDAWPSTRPASSGYPDPVTNNRTCCQSCHRKGQLHRTLLIAGDAEDQVPEWTIVYSHRSFASFDPEAAGLTLAQAQYPYANQTAISNVRVYRGDTASATTCMTVDFRAFHPSSLSNFFTGLLSVPAGLPVGTGASGWIQVDDAGYNPATDGVAKLDDLIDRLRLVDDVRHPSFTGSGTLATDWTHEVRYTYTDSSDLFMQNKEVFPAAHSFPDGGVAYHATINNNIQPRLIAVIQDERLGLDNTNSPVARTTGAAYRYSQALDTVTQKGMHEPAMICAVFEPAAVSSLFAAHQVLTSPIYTEIEDLIFSLAVDDLDATTPFIDDSENVPVTGGELRLREVASKYFGMWGTDHDELTSPDDNRRFLPGVRRIVDEMPLPGGATERSFGELGSRIDADTAPVESLLSSTFMDEMVQQLGVALPEDQLILLTGGPLVYASGSGGQQKTHKVYRFAHLPVGLHMQVPHGRYETGWHCRIESTNVDHGTDPRNTEFVIDRAALMFPHRVMAIGDFEDASKFSGTTGAPIMAAAANLNTPLWYAVIDEYSNLDSTLVPVTGTDESGFEALGTLAATMPEEYRPNSRRIVALNAMGYVVWEETYEVTPTGLQLAGGEGHREVYIYDDFGRVEMIKSYGWHAAKRAGVPEASNGLVTVYDYDYDGTSGFEECPHPRRIGVQWGDNGDTINTGHVQWLVEYARDADRPEIVLTEVWFDTAFTGNTILPITGVTASQVSSQQSQRNIVFHAIDFDTPSGGAGEPAFTKAITQKASAQAWDEFDASAVKKLAIVTQGFDGEGNLVAVGRGLVSDITNLGGSTGDIFYVDWMHYDDEGRVLIEVQDAQDGASYSSVYDASVSTTATINTTFGWTPSLPVGVAHAGYVTSNRYGEFGLEDTTFPNGEVRQIEYKRVFEDLEVATFIGVTAPHGDPTDPTDDVFMPPHSTLAKHVEHGIEVVRVAALVTPDGVIVHPSMAGAMEPVITMEAEYDPSGRPSSQKFSNRDGESFEFKSTFNQYGTVDRVETALGTITRRVYDEIGRLRRVYRGTDDWIVHFGAPPSAPVGNEDMVLVETRRYGEGIHDAMQLTQVRTYRDQPANVYDPDLEDVEGAGQLTYIAYDWRMRPVIRVECTDGLVATPIRVAVTHLDQMGRSRFEAIYDAGILTNQNPSHADFVSDMLTALPTGGSFLYGGSMPVATDFYDASPVTHLVSLSETIYSQRGAIQEERDYDLVALAGKYTVTKTFYDHNGQPVYVEQPGEGVMEVSYDAFGREGRRSVRADGVEVTRVETSYSPDGMPEKIFSYDRVDGASGTDLDNTNSVITGTYHWYIGGDLVCSAELGTWRSGAAPYGAGAAAWPAYDSTSPPVTYDTATSTFTTSLPTAFVPSGGSIAARISAYVYDDRGNRSLIRHPDGTVTRHVYDDWGNIALTQEGITLDTSGGLDTVGRATQYRYENGKLVRVAALLPPMLAATDPTADLDPSFQATAPADSYQITEFVYGAEVVSWDSSLHQFTGVSANNDWVGEVRFPDANGDPTDPSENPDLKFQYYPDGLLASRTDARGVRFEHLYDDLGRRIWTHVIYPDTTDPFDGGTVKPADRIELVGYEYHNASGVLTRATAWSEYTPGTPPVDADIVARSEFTYDQNQRLLTEWQQRGDKVTASSPKIDYVWQVQHHDGGNQARLSSMQYPQHLDAGIASGRLTLDFIYGTTLSIDDVLGRVHEIEAGVNTATNRLASFAYTGSGIRVRRAVSDSSGIERAIEGFLASDGTVTNGYEHLDQFGRIRDLHWRDSSSVTQYRAEYSYDAMGNRIEASVTRRNSSQVAVPDTWSWDYGFDALQRLIQADADEDDGMSGRTSLATHAWAMDPLGNWAGDGTLPGLHVTDGAAGLRDDDIVQEVGRFNRIESRSIDGSTPTPFVYDAMGNLVSDGVYWYRYDAWNRLIQVVEDPGAFAFDADGKKIGTGPVFADVVSVLAYDSLGRLVGRQAPYPGTADEWRTETYFYDGARRIAERWKDPIIGNNGGGNNGFQQNQQTQYEINTEREYVYTPGYIDEFVAEYDADGDHWPVLQDANFNAVALAHEDGRVARQRVLSPYGRVIQEDSTGFVTGSPATRIGHQGLFAERLDADTRQDPQAAGGTVVWHNRQRTLHAGYGRFLQRDPHATGVTVSQSLWWHSGERPIESAASGDMQPDMIGTLLPNQYLYVASQPLGLVDPSGGYPLAPGFYGPGWSVGGVIYHGPGQGLSQATRNLVAAETHLRDRASGRSGSRSSSGALAAIEITGRMIGATYAAALYDGGPTDAWARTMDGIQGDALMKLGAEATTMTLGENLGLMFPLFKVHQSGYDPFIIGNELAGLLAPSVPFAGVAVGAAAVYSGVLEYMIESVYDW